MPHPAGQGAAWRAGSRAFALQRVMCSRPAHKDSLPWGQPPRPPDPPRVAGAIPVATTWTLAPPGARYGEAKAVWGARGTARLVEAVAGISTPF